MQISRNNIFVLQFHEDCDRTKFCALSCVVRWGFMFADMLCKNLAIDLIPGRHFPVDKALSSFTKDPEKRNIKQKNESVASWSTIASTSKRDFDLHSLSSENIGSSQFSVDPRKRDYALDESLSSTLYSTILASESGNHSKPLGQTANMNKYGFGRGRNPYSS